MSAFHLNNMKTNRFQAFGLHLLGSLVVALISSALVFLTWYRWPLPVATGVTEIFATLLMVDVVIGPCITFVVFNPEKKELKLDLAIVLLLQTSALLYGLHTVFITRPVYLVFNADRFDLVYANDLTEEKLNKVKQPQFKALPWFGVKVVAAQMPDDIKERNKILFSALKGGDDLPQLPQYYVAYKEIGRQVLRHLHTLEEMKPFNKDKEGYIGALASKYASIKDGVGFLPLRGKVQDLAVIVRRDSAEVLEIVDLRPWNS